MLKKLRLIDFKTYKNTEINFSPGINIITGDSGHGKTNILLGLNLVANNRPLGVGYIRRGQDHTTVILDVDQNGVEYNVTRKRGKLENSYTLGKEGKDIGDPLTAFGNSPPEEVSEIINLSNINVQKQREPYFLVFNPPGQIATYIRSITKLDEIGKTTKLLSSKIRSEKGEISHCQEELKSTTDKLKIIEKIDLEQLGNLIVETRNVLGKIEELKVKIQRLATIGTTLKKLEDQQINIPDDIDQLIGKVKTYSDFVIKVSIDITQLRVLLGRMKEVDKSKINLPDDLSILSTADEVVQKYNNIYKRINILFGLSENLQDIDFTIEDINKQLEQLCIDKKSLIEKLDSCPLCGITLTEESKELLLKGI